MASTTPPIIPISTMPTATAIESLPPITTTPALRSFITHLYDQIRTGFSHRRPWSELVDRSAFSKPDSLADATHRIRKNYSYFRINYLSLIAAVLSFSLLTHPFSFLLLISLLSTWTFLYLFRPSDPPLVFLGRTFSDRETLGSLILVTVFVLFLTSVGSVLTSALLLGVGLVCVHGSFRVPEDLFLDEQQEGGGGGAPFGFLSFLGSAAKNAASSAAPAVAAAAAAAARV